MLLNQITIWIQSLYQRWTVSAFTGLWYSRMSDLYQRLPGRVTDSVSELYAITHRHKIYRIPNELTTLGSYLSHEQTRRLLSSTYGLWVRTPWCEQITKMAQTQIRERILELKTQHTRLKEPVPTNEPNLSLYRNERGTNITMHCPIIDTWQKIIVFG